MDIISLLLIAIGLSVDSFAASITTGACTKKVKLSYALKVALFMALFQGIMPLGGWLIGNSFKDLIQEYDHWIAFILLIAIGSKMIYEGIAGNKNKPKFKHSENLKLVSIAFATSIDALIIGITFGLIDVNIWLAMIIIGLTTLIFSLTGVLIGKKIRKIFNKKIEIIGGLVLILLGTKILIEHLYFS